LRRLILLRHAKSSWDDSSLPDFDRPLAERGERDAPFMAKRLAARAPLPTLLVSSPALRALRTAELAAPSLGIAAADIRTHADLYLASPRALLAIVAALPQQHTCVLLVAHNPGLTELANELLPALELDNLPTAGAVAIDTDADDWPAFARAERRLGFYDFPKNRGRG
jgi:phosphohistidine phosphatase